MGWFYIIGFTTLFIFIFLYFLILVMLRKSMAHHLEVIISRKKLIKWGHVKVSHLLSKRSMSLYEK